MDEIVCLICRKPGNLIEIKQKAIGSLCEASKKKMLQKIPHLPEKLASVYIHATCQVSYKRESSINDARTFFGRTCSEGKKIDKIAMTFDFSSLCFFCEKNLQSHEEKVHFVKSTDTKEKIIEKIQDRQRLDVSDKAHLARLDSVPNLASVNARYHSACMAKFYTNRATLTIGRPCSGNTKNFVEQVIKCSEKNNHECQFSINELKSGFTGDVPDITTVRKKLEDNFSAKISCHIIKKDLVILFRNSLGKKLCEE